MNTSLLSQAPTMELANILVATDLSEHCGAAAKWAQQFKERVGADRVIVEHVIELSVSSWLTSAFEVLDDDAQREAAEKQVSDWYAEHTGSEPDGVVLRAGSCLAQLTEVVEEFEGPTLLVVSMSGKGAFTRFFLGSTAHALASQPPCPVAVIHPEHAQIKLDVPIVTGTDLSYNGQRAVEYAGSLARHVGVPLEVVHAYGAPTSPLVNLEATESQEATTKSVTTLIEGGPGLQGDLDTRIRVLYDDPADAIVGHARELDSDLIVLGHSGETIFVQSVLGSVAQRVLNHMPCSMIIVPPVAGTGDEEE